MADSKAVHSSADGAATGTSAPLTDASATSVAIAESNPQLAVIGTSGARSIVLTRTGGH